MTPDNAPVRSLPAPSRWVKRILRIFYSPIRWCLRKRIEARLRKIGAKTSGRLLELGCGPVSYRACFPKCEALSTDICPTPATDRVEDARALSFPDGSFDVVLCISMLEHVFEYSKVIDEIHRVLRADGDVVIGVPFLYPMHDDPEDFWRFSPFALERLLEPRFRVLTMSLSGVSVFIPAILAHARKR